MEYLFSQYLLLFLTNNLNHHMIGTIGALCFYSSLGLCDNGKTDISIILS